MTNSVGIKGRNNQVPIPDCPSCNVGLKFDYIGSTLDYIRGSKACLACDSCRKRFVCQSGKVLEELKNT